MEKTEKIWNRRFILLFITNLLVLAAFYASIPIIPIYCGEIGITGSKIGIVLTAMSVATILFRPVAGYLLDNFNRYRVYLLFLALFCLSFPAFIAFPLFGALIVIRLYMGAVYSVCGSATMTLAGDVLPREKITEGISRFAFTVSIGMALGPYVGLQVQNNMSSKRTKARPSATGPVQRTPLTPIKTGRITAAGTKKMICRDSESSADFAGLPIACR